MTFHRDPHSRAARIRQAVLQDLRNSGGGAPLEAMHLAHRTASIRTEVWRAAEQLVKDGTLTFTGPRHPTRWTPRTYHLKETP